MDDINIPLLVIAGPTASGKSTLAVALAKELHGEVVNIDSVQIYLGCDIGSGKITSLEAQGVRHHLIDIRDPDACVDVAEICNEAKTAIAEVVNHKKLPIVVAGSTMYVRSLFHGLASLPGKDMALRKELDDLSSLDLFAELNKHDPESALKLHPNDRVRIIRALEVFYLTREKISTVHLKHSYSGADFKALFLCLSWRREDLHARIAARTEKMMAHGILTETEQLMNLYGENAPVLKTVGYAECVQVLKKEKVSSSLKESINASTRQLAKRQITFWRNQPSALKWKIRASCDEVDRATLIESVAARLRETLLTNEIWYLDAARIFESNANPLG